MYFNVSRLEMNMKIMKFSESRFLSNTELFRIMHNYFDGPDLICSHKYRSFSEIEYRIYCEMLQRITSTEIVLDQNEEPLANRLRNIYKKSYYKCYHNGN